MRILWDVDTQIDFIEPGGKLYFDGAETALPAMRRLVEAARAAGLVHVASADDHELADAEISDEPDFDRTWPPHCLRGTRGGRKVAETEQIDPVPLGLERVPGRYLRGREFLILKKTYDPFSNPNADVLLEQLHPDEILLFGVATDICDDAAVRALLDRGRRIRFVEDASRGVDAGRVAECTASWRDRGVELTTVEEVTASLGAA